MSNVQHSSRSDMWYSPLSVIMLAQQVLGHIDLDPASDEHGNARVGAQYFITREQDGLVSPWIPGTIFLNPPGGKLKNRSIAALFWWKLMTHLESGQLTHGIFMGFSVEQLAVTQKYHSLSMLDFPICVPRDRIHFDGVDAAAQAPSHSNVIVYVPGTTDKTDLFVETFSKLGKVKA